MLLTTHADLLQGPARVGGVGKTQIASEYLHRFAADYDILWWISTDQPTPCNAPVLAELAGGAGAASRGQRPERVQGYWRRCAAASHHPVRDAGSVDHIPIEQEASDPRLECGR